MTGGSRVDAPVNVRMARGARIVEMTFDTAGWKGRVAMADWAIRAKIPAILSGLALESGVDGDVVSFENGAGGAVQSGAGFHVRALGGDLGGARLRQ